VLELAPHSSLKDYADMLARLRAMPVLLSNDVLLKEGLKLGITPPRVTLRRPSPSRSKPDGGPRKERVVETVHRVSDRDSRSRSRAIRSKPPNRAQRKGHSAFAQFHVSRPQLLAETRETIAATSCRTARPW